MTRLRRSRAKKVDPDLLAWLRDDGPAPTRAKYFLSDDAVRALWDENKASILDAWVIGAPGTRPPFWWRFEAPEPRRRLGGTGTPCHAVFANEPEYVLGVPSEWVEGWEDISPRYESQAAYLQRLGLLAPGEARRLGARALQPETLYLP